ncbi:hypothetical protein [Achromobacter sp.]|uniref:hypothetical protein n=1 Tax=Achromobacter sp. TaxID=134375 RepID=UPI0028AEE30F|nr:hypothetical protein [Achromobacter sp.]
MHPAQPALPAGATRTLAAFASGLRYASIPDAVIGKMKTSLIDSIGCCLYGISHPGRGTCWPWRARTAASQRLPSSAPV